MGTYMGRAFENEKNVFGLRTRFNGSSFGQPSSTLKFDAQRFAKPHAPRTHISFQTGTGISQNVLLVARWLGPFRFLCPWGMDRSESLLQSHPRSPKVLHVVVQRSCKGVK